jgi:hypothetical protein
MTRRSFAMSLTICAMASLILIGCYSKPVAAPTPAGTPTYTPLPAQGAPTGGGPPSEMMNQMEAMKSKAMSGQVGAGAPAAPSSKAGAGYGPSSGPPAGGYGPGSAATPK